MNYNIMDKTYKFQNEAVHVACRKLSGVRPADGTMDIDYFSVLDYRSHMRLNAAIYSQFSLNFFNVNIMHV